MIRLIIRCADDADHAKKINISKDLGMRWATTFGELLCGTSPMFIYPPGEGSPIGRCAICGGKLGFEIEEI